MGIGEALAREFSAEDNASLILVDIDAKSLQKVAGSLSVPVKTYAADLADIESLPELFETIERENGQVDVLVNNAGIMMLRTLEGTEWEQGEKLLKLDLLSPMRLMQLALGGMQQRRHGFIINIASMAGVTPIPGSTFYSAAKAGIAIASEIVRTEVKDFNIDVMTVYPGPISTNLESNVRQQVNENFFSNLLPTGDRLEIARAIYEGYKKKEGRVIFPRFYETFKAIPDLTYRLTELFSPMPRE